MLLLLRALIRGGTGPSAPWADPGGAGLLPTCSFCLGRAKPPASPPEPGPLHPAVAPEGSPERRSSFVALKRLLERSRSVPELLRWLWQNPGRVSGAHYALALGHLGRLLPPGKGGLRLEPLLHQPDFQHLSRAVARRCAHFDDATLVRCLQASAALGLPGDGRLVLALQDEAQRRLERLRQRNVSTVSGNNVRLRPLSHAAATTTPLAEACKGSLEEQRRLQTLFLLLSYYCLRAQKQQEEAPPVRREFLRLVRLSLRQLQVAQEQELALLEEMLCLCAREATGSDTLGAIFGSQLFYQNRRENFVRGMADWFPGKAGGLTPPTMALVAKYLARHRLREPRLLDAIATFLLERAQQLDSKPVELPPVQPRRPLPPPGGGSAEAGRLPAGRPQRPHVLGATWPLPSCPPAPSLLFRLPGQRHHYKGLVGEALCQLVGRGCFRQDEVVPPGYCLDFLLWVTPSGSVLPLGGPHSSPKGAALASGSQNPASLGLESTAGSLLPPDSLCGPSREPSPGTPSLSSPTRTDHSLASSNGTHFFPAWGPETGQGLRLPPVDEGGLFSPQGPSTKGAAQGGPQEKEGLHRVVLSVNDQWHYCHGSSVLVGSRAMRSRHLRLLGYRLVQLPYQELEKMRGIEETKVYLRRKLEELQF
ncbi:fas-activated serine/threonine kinase isoform X3 [Podarcis muralis]